MKKLLSILLAALLLLPSMSVLVCADDDDIIDTTFDSYTFEEFSGKVISVCAADEVGSTEISFSTYGKRCMGIYLPEEIGVEDITEIYLYPSYVAVGFEYEDVYIQLQFYHTTYGESLTYTYAKENGQALTTDDGNTVYNYTSLGAEHYYWLDGDKAFCLYVNSTEGKGEYLSLCFAVYHSFSEAFNFSAEALDGKVRLTWDEIVEDGTYTVYWKRSSSDEWKVAGTTSKHKVNITGLKNGVSYDFKVMISGEESEVVTATPTDDIWAEIDFENLPTEDYFGNQITYDDRGVVTVTVSDVTSTQLTVTLTNNGDIDVNFESLYLLEEYKDGEWSYVETDYTSLDTTLDLFTATAAGGQDSALNGWTALYGQLPTGHYRILQYYYYEAEGENVYVYGVCGFDIE